MSLDTKEKVTPPRTESDRVFEEMINRPDMQALNDQGDAAIRDDLNAKERNPSTKKAQDEDVFNYLKSQGLMSDKPKAQAGNWFSRHKKGIAGGGAAIITIGGFFSLAMPLKLQGILSMVQDMGMVRIEGYIEKRAKRIVLQAVMNKVGGLKGERNIVKSGSLMGSIVKTMTASKYEERLAAKGIEFTKGEDGIVRVRAIDKTKNLTIKTGTFRVTEVKQAEEFLDGIPVTKKIMTALVKEDLGVMGFFVRGKMVRWMLQSLGLPRFGTQKPKETDPDKISAEKATEDIAEEAGQKTKALDNLTNLQDNVDNKSDADAASSQAKQATQDAVNNAVDETLDEVGEELKDASSAKVREAMNKSNEKLMAKITERIGLAGASKAIPYYGWITGAARVNTLTHWLAKNSVNGKAFRALGAVGGIRMAYQFGKWIGLATQAKLDQLDTNLFNYYLPYLDGLERSSVFNCIQNNWKAGCDKVGTPSPYSLNETAPSWFQNIKAGLAKNGISLDNWAKYADLDPSYMISKVIVKIDDAVMGVAGGIMGWIIAQPLKLVPQDVKDSANAQISKLTQGFMDLVFKMAGLDIDPFGGGEKLLPILAAGSVFTANRHAESLGLHAITQTLASTQTQQFLAERNQYIQDKGLLYALFSPEVSTSVTTKLVMATPSTGSTLGDATSTLASFTNLLKAPSRAVASALSPSASADTTMTPESFFNAVPFGITDAELASPVSEQVMNGEACKSSQTNAIADFFGIETPASTEFSSCDFDMAVSQSVLCSLDKELSEKSADCNPDIASANQANTQASGTFTWPLSKEDWPGDVFDCDFRYSGNTVHTGIDISVSYKPVVAATSGTIRRPSENFGMVDIEYTTSEGKKMYFNYQHLSEIKVTEGQQVKAGDPIGVTGNKGTTAPHLHLSLWDEPVLGGHISPSSRTGQITLSHMWHPLSILPDDGRNVSTCGSPPYKVPGGN